MQNRAIVAVLVVVLVIGMSAGIATGYYLNHQSSSKVSTLAVFAAGSLTSVLGNNFYPQFTNLTGIKVDPTFAGSVSGASEIDSGIPFDVFVSAAAGVIPQYMFPNKTANWMVIFASNEMAITWLNSSFSITNPYWFENLTAAGVKVGVSNASLDPSGFQAIEMVKLAGILYTNWTNPYVKYAFNNDTKLFNTYNEAWNSWFGPNGNLVRDGLGNGYPLNYSMALYYQLFNYSYRHGNLIPTTEEFGLKDYLKSGSVDYALTYKSQALNQKLDYYQKGKGINGLSSWINLGNISKSEVTFYSEVTTAGPAYSDIGNFPGGPILYSVTIPTSSKNTQAAQQLIYYLITSLGSSMLRSSDFNPISDPFIYSLGSSAPSFLSGITQQVPSYLPTSSYEEV